MLSYDNLNTPNKQEKEQQKKLRGKKIVVEHRSTCYFWTEEGVPYFFHSVLISTRNCDVHN